MLSLRPTGAADVCAADIVWQRPSGEVEGLRVFGAEGPIAQKALLQEEQTVHGSPWLWILDFSVDSKKNQPVRG